MTPVIGNVEDAFYPMGLVVVIGERFLMADVGVVTCPTCDAVSRSGTVDEPLGKIVVEIIGEV